MTVRVVTWDPSAESIGSAVVAIGVFDGVHLGHQALLADTVADAAARGVQAVVVTFDRDPDQVVSPQAAAPQLLALPDKDLFIAETGIDVILVVPFTAQIAGLAPEAFLRSVLLCALAPVAVHVGSDFRFGTMASGDVFTLQRVGLECGFAVVPHDLVTADGQAVTSTRIRALVAAGNVAEAATLLGRPPRVVGIVHRGRGEGASLGFATANMVPAQFAALPGEGVYAGRAILADGTAWASAIAVGKPPMFPEAKDYLEAHLIGFEGDLYDQPLTLEFWERLRDQQRYADLESLKAAIAKDVDAALEIAGFAYEEFEGTAVTADTIDALESLADDQDLGDCVSDPAALEAAEQAAMCAEDSFDRMAIGEWVPLVSRRFNTLAAGPESFSLVAPLEAADIPFVWDPFPPEASPAGLRDAQTRPFTVMVPAAIFEDADAALSQAGTAGSATQLANGDASYVDDPEALEAAENAVRGVDREARRSRLPAPEGWVSVAERMPYDRKRLGAISFALAAEGIDADWQPFEPNEAPLLKLFGLHDTIFSLCVPEAEAESARHLIAEVDARTL